MNPWKLPFLVAAIVVPISFAFYLGGPGIGVAVGALVAVAIVAVAVSQRPRGVIEPLEDAPGRRALIVVGDPLEEPDAVERVAKVVRADEPSEVLVLSPARTSFLDRWASDVESARQDAQRRLVISVAALAAAGIAARARVGDEDVVQAVEDELGSFPATLVILVSSSGDEDPAAATAAGELRERLQPEFRWIVTGPAAR